MDVYWQIIDLGHWDNAELLHQSQQIINAVTFDNFTIFDAINHNPWRSVGFARGGNPVERSCVRAAPKGSSDNRVARDDLFFNLRLQVGKTRQENCTQLFVGINVHGWVGVEVNQGIAGKRSDCPFNIVMVGVTFKENTAGILVHDLGRPRRDPGRAAPGDREDHPRQHPGDEADCNVDFESVKWFIV